MKKIIKIFIVTSLITFSLAQTGLAGSVTIPKPTTLPGPVSESAEKNRTYLTDTLIPTIVKNLSGILGSASLFFLIFGGVQYLTAYNNTDRANNAKNTIVYAIIGLCIGILSYSIVNIISYLDGLKATQKPGPPIIVNTQTK